MKQNKPENLKINPIIDADLPIPDFQSDYTKGEEIFVNNSHLENPIFDINNLPNLNQIPDLNSNNEVQNISQSQQQNNNNYGIDNSNVPNNEGQQILGDVNLVELNDRKLDYNLLILNIMVNTILIQFFFLLVMAFFIWNLTYIVTIVYMAILDLLVIAKSIKTLINPKYFFLKKFKF